MPFTPSSHDALKAHDPVVQRIKNNPRPRVAFLSCGGTIACEPAPPRKVTLEVEHLLKRVRLATEIATITAIPERRIKKDSKTLTTSICGPSRFTGALKNSEFQHQVIEDNIDQFDKLCGEPESTERRLRMLKEQRNPTGIRYDELLEDTQAIQDESE